MNALDFLQVDPAFVGTRHDHTHIECDMHCPAVSFQSESRLADKDVPNFWKKSCLAKTVNQDGACRLAYCPTGNVIRAEFGHDPIVKRTEPDTSGATYRKVISDQEKKRRPKCACGEPAMRERNLGFLAGKWGVIGVFCSRCGKRERQKAMYRAKLMGLGVGA